jgi:uncharacterized protein (TIGR02118 family)
MSIETETLTPVRIGLIRKKPDWTPEQFRTYWRDRHGPLVAQTPNLRSYWQNHVVDRLQRGISFARGPVDFDGFSQLWFDDVDQAHKAFSDGALAGAFMADERHFIGELSIVSAVQRVVVPLPDAGSRSRLLKRISTLRRRDDISEDDFRREWKHHAGLVSRMPGVSAYRQNIITQRERVKGQPAPYEQLPLDGIVELWFETPETLNAAFDSPQGKVTMAHAETFLSEITAFVVEEARIV